MENYKDIYRIYQDHLIKLQQAAVDFGLDHRPSLERIARKLGMLGADAEIFKVVVASVFRIYAAFLVGIEVNHPLTVKIMRFWISFYTGGRLKVGSPLSSVNARSSSAVSLSLSK